ncbi:MAG: acyl-CoA dehydrogenase family protein, partial [Actinomycetota bacterium]
MDLSFTAAEAAFAAEVREWLAANAEPAPRFATIADEVEYGRRWQARMAADRWVGIHWPREFGGRGATPVEVALFNMEYARSRALQPINRVGINLAGPTLLVHGTEAQKARWLPTILTAEEIWCQLFSEPDAGSDLASLQTRAEKVDGGWRLTGQKVWTSYAQFARWGICLARTNSEAPKHRGLSYLIVDMQAPGIEVRPLVQITGDAEFNEVFFADARVQDSWRLGREGDGWKVAITTLMNERVSLSGAGSIGGEAVGGSPVQKLIDRHRGTEDRLVRQALAQAYIESTLIRINNQRAAAKRKSGSEAGPEGSITKLQQAEFNQRLQNLAIDLEGASAIAWEGRNLSRIERVGRVGAAADTASAVASGFLRAQANTIEGGTSDIMRNILG